MDTMKKSLFIASCLALLFSLALQTADARSGCCSHHGGVCGCGCCDGSSLSAICAPYYPQCSSTTATNTSETFTPTQTPMSVTLRPTATPTVTMDPTNTLTPKPTIKTVKTVPLRKPQPK